MIFNIITLFPEMFSNVFTTSILGRGLEKSLWEFNIYNLRDFGEGKRKNVDDDIYGGGVGRLIRADVLDKAIGHIMQQHGLKKFTNENDIFYMSPRGEKITQDYIRIFCSIQRNLKEQKRRLMTLRKAEQAATS